MSKEIIVFRNKGEIDPKSITTFGVSSKENAGAIGFFGTGLKYAIAILLREGCQISVFSGTKRLDFGTRKQKVRVDDFTFVTMNKRAIGFTTEVGKTWEVWQAFREIYCNTLDEAGEFFACTEEPEPVAGETMIVVTGAKFVEAWNQRNDIVLSGEPSHKVDGVVEVRDGQSDYVYYRGIRALKLGSPSMYTYNVLSSMELTEDRTLKHAFMAQYYISKGVAKLEHKHVLQRIVTAKDCFEQSFDFNGSEPSEAFKTVVRLATKSFTPGLNRSAVSVCQLSILESLDGMDTMALSAVDQSRMDKAISFCKAIGFEVDEYPIIVSEFLGEGVMGRAHDEKIFIGKRALMMGTKQVAGTLIEEFLHLRHKLHDETYAMQNFLFDSLVSLGEQITGEPL